MKNIKFFLRIILSVVIIYAFCMIAFYTIFSYFSLDSHVDLDIFIWEREIPLLICLPALGYTLYSIWNNKS
jgi:hypothetical protein